MGKKKFEYACSPELTTKGQLVIVHTQILCCKKRQAPPTEELCTKAEKYRMDIDTYMEEPMKEMRQETRRNQNEFSECKKIATAERAEWIIKLAKDQSQAKQDQERENKMRRMLQTVR